MPPAIPRAFRLATAAAVVAAAVSSAAGPGPAPPACDLLVSTTADVGEGSLRQAVVRANAGPGRCTIRFDSTQGPFATPQTIALGSDLPVLTGDVVLDGTIEGRLWVATGVTISGAGVRRVLHLAPGARATVACLTIADGRAVRGGGILNEGTLVVKGVAFLRNAADRDGGAVAGVSGAMTVVNSTFADNRARKAGGGLAHLGGAATVTNCTFSGNRAGKGGGIFSRSRTLLRNTILAGNDGRDCVAASGVEPGSTGNLIVANGGCGRAAVVADPRLEKLGLYNGPTPTFPLGGGSPAINMGDNAAAVDEDGRPLVWDQRGNGDPRFVAGFVDIGAFEVQAFPVLRVNTPEDTGARGCTGAGASDCSLRGAIELANAAGEPKTITFDARAFATPTAITLRGPLPAAAVDLTLDAAGTPGVVVRGPVPGPRAVPEHAVKLLGVTFEVAR